MSRRFRPARAWVLAFAVAVLTAFAVAEPASAVSGPAPGLCNVGAPEPCYYHVGFVSFSLSSHFVHVGQVISGTATWELPGQGHGEFPDSAFVQLNDLGHGLKLLGCHGPKHASNAKAHGENAFHVTKGHTTCRWRGQYATNWATDLGLTLAISGSQPYQAGDYYAVTGKTALEGTIRLKNDRKADTSTLGVPGAKVHITGPHGRHYNATVNSTGYWYALVDHGGTYTVHPILPKKYDIGKDPVSPKKKKVKVKLGGVGEAKFLVKDPLRLTLKFSHTSVPATGAEVNGAGVVSEKVVDATLLATEGGSPAPNVHVTIRPFEGKSHSLTNLPVLARMCGASGVSWPTFGQTNVNNDMSAYTDAKGKVSFKVITGTIPGALSIEARPLDVDGTTEQKADLARVDPIETVHVTRIEGAADYGSTVIKGVGSDIGKHGYLFHGATFIQGMQRAAASGALGAVNVAPVYRNGSSGAVLVYPAGTRLRLAPNGELLNPQGVIVEPDEWKGTTLFADFETAARHGGIVRFPTVAEWRQGGEVTWKANNETGGWNLGPAVTTPWTIYSADSQGYSFGFGYLGVNGC